MNDEIPAVKTLAEVEREHILGVYAASGNSKAHTAEQLGVSLKTLYNRLNKYTEDGQSHPVVSRSPPRPVIVCLCGSTRFYPAFQEANYRETMQGKIVLSVGFYRPSPQSEAELVRHEGTHGETWGCTPEQKIALNALHFRKIELADEILILNVGGYIGESTRNELHHAISLNKRIRYLEKPCQQ